MIRILTILLAFAAWSLPAAARPAIDHVFVIVMENKDAQASGLIGRNYIYGNTRRAPYINKDLIPGAARANNFNDLLPKEKSEPHYILMEAGTNEFPDTSFHCDNDPGRPCDDMKTPNWTSSPDHLVTQLATAGLTWRAYVEGLDPAHTGACPVKSSARYAAKHVPFVFFADIAGAPPSSDAPACAAQMRGLDALKQDLASGDIAHYTFITPDLCSDMHGASGCSGNTILEGDSFLKGLVPQLLMWSAANKGLVMIVWDEGDDTLKIPFILAGPGVKTNYESDIAYDHKAIVRTVEEIFGLPVLPAVKDAPDFRDMFEAGIFP